MKNNPPILFFGTPEFALPALEALIKNGYRIAAAITRPDERVGRKQILTPPPIKVAAERYNIPVFQPERLDARDFVSGKIPRADLFIVAAYGKIIPVDILKLPRLGAINIHPSLLPRWRGPSPIQAAILHGDIQTGVTIMQMDAQMDHGPAIAASSFPLPAPGKITYPELHDRLAKLGAELLIKTLSRWITGGIIPVPQDESQATYCKLLTKDGGRIDWTKPADQIERMVRAYRPWPGSWTVWKSKSGPRRIRIEEADAIDDAPPAGGAAGMVWQNELHPLLIKSGRGSLAVKKLRLEGKSPTDAASFLRGHPALLGAILL